MTKENAKKILKMWKDYQEINDKLFAIFMTNIPQSFLPLPADIIMDGLSIMIDEYYDMGDIHAAKTIEKTLSFLVWYTDDSKALDKLISPLGIGDSNLRKIHLNNLKQKADFWISGNIQYYNLDMPELNK